MNAQQFQNALVALISEHWSFFRQFISLEPTLRHITDASKYANSIATVKHDPTFVELYAASQILKADIVVRRQDNETHICPQHISILRLHHDVATNTFSNIQNPLHQLSGAFSVEDPPQNKQTTTTIRPLMEDFERLSATAGPSDRQRPCATSPMANSNKTLTKESPSINIRCLREVRSWRPSLQALILDRNMTTEDAYQLRKAASETGRGETEGRSSKDAPTTTTLCALSSQDGGDENSPSISLVQMMSSWDPVGENVKAQPLLSNLQKEAGDQYFLLGVFCGSFPHSLMLDSGSSYNLISGSLLESFQASTTTATTTVIRTINGYRPDKWIKTLKMKVKTFC